MRKGKWAFLAGLALATISLGWGTDGQQRPQTKRPEQQQPRQVQQARPVPQPRQVERNVTYKSGTQKMPRLRSITPAQRKAAALRATAARAQMGVKAGKAGIQAGPLAAPSPGGTPDYFGPYGNWAYSPTTLRKFVDTLPGLGSANANNRGQYIPVATPMDAAAAGVPADGDYYEIGLTEYAAQMHQDLPPTTLRGYKDLNPAGDGASQYLGPLIIAQRNKPVRIKFSNLLTPNSSFFLPVDTTVMGAGNGPTGNPYSVNRATLHLHGGNTPWISDGTPHQWTVPAGESTAYPKGVSTQNVPDMPVPGDGQMTFYYSNQQSGRLLFYHDHAYGITRLNVYAGEAAGYLITDPAEDALIFNGTKGVIPNNGGGVYTYGIPLIIQDKTFVDASKIALQDPTWNWGTTAPTPNTGDLWLPHVYMPNQNPYDDTGANAMGRWDYGPWFWPVFPPANGEIPNPYFGTSVRRTADDPGNPESVDRSRSFHGYTDRQRYGLSHDHRGAQGLSSADPERLQRPLPQPPAVPSRSRRPVVRREVQHRSENDTRRGRPDDPGLLANDGRQGRRRAGSHDGRSEHDPDRERKRVPAGARRASQYAHRLQL